MVTYHSFDALFIVSPLGQILFVLKLQFFELLHFDVTKFMAVMLVLLAQCGSCESDIRAPVVSGHQGIKLTLFFFCGGLENDGNCFAQGDNSGRYHIVGIGVCCWIWRDDLTGESVAPAEVSMGVSTGLIGKYHLYWMIMMLVDDPHSGNSRTLCFVLIQWILVMLWPCFCFENNCQ